jgi:hypothetical protein
MIEDRSEASHLAVPSRQANPCHVLKFRLLGGRLPEGLSHLKETMVSVPLLSQRQSPIEVLLGQRGLRIDPKPGLGVPGLGRGSSGRVRALGLGVGPVP